MATAKPLPSGKWRVQFMVNGKRHSATDTTAKKAEKKADEKKARLQGVTVDINKMTVGEAIDEYINTRNFSPSSIRATKQDRKNMFPDLMAMKLSKITYKDINKAISTERTRTKAQPTDIKKTLSASTIINHYTFLKTVLLHYMPNFELPKDKINLPTNEIVKKQYPVVLVEQIFDAVQGTDIELPVLLAVWLSLTVSEIKGLTKSKSIQQSGQDYFLFVRSVVVRGEKGEVEKARAKEYKRNRELRIPPEIMELIDKVETDRLVTIGGDYLTKKWKNLQKKKGLPHMTFHFLRHLNASEMLVAEIPNLYAQQRGGWSNDKVMTNTYQEIYTEYRATYDDKFDAHMRAKKNASYTRTLQEISNKGVLSYEHGKELEQLKLKAGYQKIVKTYGDTEVTIIGKDISITETIAHRGAHRKFKR